VYARPWRSGISPVRSVFGLIALAAVGAGAPSPPSAPSDPPQRAAPPGASAAVIPRSADAHLKRAADSPQPPAPNPASGRDEPLAARSDGLGEPLIAGQVVEPIDLAGALRLAGARDLDIAIAHEVVAQAIANWSEARALWLPSIYLGPNWIRHDGQAQMVEGGVRSISKSALFLGATAAGGASATGPVLAGGPAPVTGLTSILRISDAIFTPLAARQVVSARQFGLQAVTNDVLLSVAEAYFDLQNASGRLAIAREAVANAEMLSDLTESYVRSGKGLPADHQRSIAERDRQRRNIEAAVGQLEIASAELVRIVRLDPRIVVAPLEPPEAMFRLVPDDAPLDELIPTALRSRPELAEAQALVQATLVRLRQARLRPLIPSVAFRFSGGGFGGGVNGFFGHFGARSDTDVNLFWELQNLGFADRAIARRNASEQRAALLQQLKVQDRVAAEVVATHKARLAAARQVTEAGRAVTAALESFRLNLVNIRQAVNLPSATRPIEVLQPIQALVQARTDYLDAVQAYNRAQFRLYRALGQPPLVTLPSSSPPPPAAVPAASGAATAP